jgi:hypothetical protein
MSKNENTITALVTVELTANEEFFHDWLDDQGEGYSSLPAALVDQFKEHLEYHIDAMDKDDVPYDASVVSVSH